MPCLLVGKHVKTRLLALPFSKLSLAMVNNCCVVGCNNYVGKKKGLGFYRFPLSDKERCGKWEAAVHREGWVPKSHTRICSEHFQTGMISTNIIYIYMIFNHKYIIYIFITCIGKPNSHPSHPDYIPSKFPDVYKVKTSQSEQNFSRLHRRMERLARREEAEEVRRQAEEDERCQIKENEQRLIEEKKAA